MSHKTDLQIAQEARMLPITEVAKKIHISDKDLELYGHYKAKLPLSLIDKNKINDSNLILVTALTPTPAGEGKTTVTIGLTEALNKIGKQSLAVIREPSLGPVFGIKGGAAGGGYSQVVPMEDINLHFTGDFNAIEKANNLLAAVIDNNLQSKTRNLNIDPRTIKWKRVIDLNDRALRHIVVGLGGTVNGIPREDGFNITAASEIMAILCLANDIEDLKEKLGNIFVGYTFDNKAVYARDLNVVGSMALLLKDAIKPNLVQTLENNPVLIHGGPFANIAQGTNSVIATKMGMSLSKYVITEAGFGADLGAEKFFDIKCTHAELKPKISVIVATVRALRHHGGAPKDEYNTPSTERVSIGCENLIKHIENAKKFGVQPIVAINKFISDTPEEWDIIKQKCFEIGVEAVVTNGWAKGGEGAVELAESIINLLSHNTSDFKPLYNALTTTIKEKIEIVATEIYGADTVILSQQAKKDLKKITELGLGKLPICMAKTQSSFSDDPTKINNPKGFSITVREFEIAAGAGFIVPILGKMMRMPGLPSVPASEGMDINKDGVITGLS